MKSPSEPQLGAIGIAPGAEDDVELTRIDAPGQLSTSERNLLKSPSVFEAASDLRRYELRRVLGEGGNGRVYAAFDRDLRREVALKVVRLPPELSAEHFMREARVTAGLVHPNIPALYDVAELDGTFFLSMQRVTGHSLGALIREAIAARSSEAMPIGALVEAMLKVSDALAYAHSRGVTHRDVKPDNVMIGAYGEVMLVDWGAAYATRDAPPASELVIGTPSYMAPEQRQPAAPTPASDIYGLGATLFHALLLRKPITGSDSERFWQRKAQGSIELPTHAELSRVPRALVAIALKAMSPSPKDRYPSMAALSDALRDVLGGRNAWSAPLVHESLHDEDYLERWQPIPAGAFVRDGTSLVSSARGPCLLVFKQRLSAGVALELEGEILSGARPADLSVVWTEDELLEPEPHWPRPGTSFSLQVGAFDNLAAGIYRDFWQCISGRSLSLEVGKRYQLRVEIDELNLRLYLDGTLLAEHEQLFPIYSGHLAIYSYDAGKAFSSIKLLERVVPERISPTAIGDAFYGRQDYASAATEYARVEQRFPQTELADEACFKRGLCRLQQGRVDEAKQIWTALKAEAWRVRATLHLIDLEFHANHHRAVTRELERLLTTAPSARLLVLDRWKQYSSALGLRDPARLEPYAELRERCFPNDAGSEATAAALECERGNWRVVVERYPNQHMAYMDACHALGEFEHVLERYPGIGWIREKNLIMLNRFDLGEAGPHGIALAHAMRGDLTAAVDVAPCLEALLALGRFEEVWQHQQGISGNYDPMLRGAALRGLGRTEEAARRGDARALCQLDAGEEACELELTLSDRLYLTHHLALRAYRRGEEPACRELLERASAMPCAAFWGDVWLHRHFLLPLLGNDSGQALRASAERVIEAFPRHWHAKGLYLAKFVLGQIDIDEFAAQPTRLFMRARVLFARALHAECAGDRALAATHYAAYLDLAALERCSDSALGDPLSERWARMRTR